MTNTDAAELQSIGTYKTKQELAYEALRDAIITCRFPPGRRLLENELAQQLGISRSPIREALKRLASEGLVNEIPHAGVTVAEVGLESLHELYLIIASLEATACREACERLEPGTLREMQESLKAMDAALAAQDMTTWAMANRAFHRLARRDCDLPYLLRVLEETWSRMQRYQVYQGAAEQRAVQSEPEHQSIALAMLQGDAEQVEALVKAHYLQGDRQFKDYLQALAQAEANSAGDVQT